MRRRELTFQYYKSISQTGSSSSSSSPVEGVRLIEMPLWLQRSNFFVLLLRAIWDTVVFLKTMNSGKAWFQFASLCAKNESTFSIALYNTNVRSTLAFRLIGSGPSNAATFASAMDMPPPIKKESQAKYSEVNMDAAEKLA